jgi:hypothetical protein
MPLPLEALLPPYQVALYAAMPQLGRAAPAFCDVLLMPCKEEGGEGAPLSGNRTLLASSCPALAALLCPSTWARSSSNPWDPVEVGIPRAPLEALLQWVRGVGLAECQPALSVACTLELVELGDALLLPALLASAVAHAFQLLSLGTVLQVFTWAHARVELEGPLARAAAKLRLACLEFFASHTVQVRLDRPLAAVNQPLPQTRALPRLSFPWTLGGGEWGRLAPHAALIEGCFAAAKVRP